MRLIVGILAFIGAGAIAVADPPSQTPTQSAATTTTAASPATPATPAASALHEATAAIDPRERMLKAKGYHLEMRNGEKYYCHNEEVLGSRVGGRKFCGTVADLADREQRSKDMAESAQRSQLNPTGN